jgi:hypothetical protein
VPPGPEDKYILDVFPKPPMSLQVDLNGQLAALLVGDKADSVHGFIVALVTGYW